MRRGVPSLSSLQAFEAAARHESFSKAALELSQTHGAICKKVNELEDGANQQVETLLKGGNTDMSTVMIAVEKADVAFQMMMQVRNKIVNAYQDIEKLQF